MPEEKEAAEDPKVQEEEIKEIEGKVAKLSTNQQEKPSTNQQEKPSTNQAASGLQEGKEYRPTGSLVVCPE